MSAPAGWYPDPSDGSRQRWWDGARWAPSPPPTFAPAVAPPYATPAKVQADTTTVWIWIAIAASVVPFVTLFLIDWDGYIDGVVGAAGGYGAPEQLLQWQLHTIAVSSISWLALAAVIVFSWLDWRELRRRGVPAPFHWSWSFFALLSGGVAVYMIGRAVVLRRRTVAAGWPPLWVWACLTALGYLVTIIWVVRFMDAIFSRLGGLSFGA